MGPEWLIDPERPRVAPWKAALLVVAAVAAPTLVAFPFRGDVTVAALDVLYLPGLLVIAVALNLGWALGTVVVCMLVFNLVHLEPYGELALKDEDGIALLIFSGITVGVSALARRVELARARSERRRDEADLLAELARLLLGDTTGPAARPHDVMTDGLSSILGVRVLLSDEPPEGDGHLDLELRDPVGESGLGWIVVPESIDPGAARRLRRIAPALGALLASARRRARAESERVAHESLRREAAVKTTLLRSVSHDVRAPLTGLTAAASALEGEHVGDADRRELADVVSTEAARVSRTIDALLDAARLDADAVEVHPEPVELADVVAAARNDVPGLDLEVDIPEGLPLAMADPLLLQRAVANLLRNAQVHADGLDVRVHGEAEGDVVRLVVSDSGPGIPAAVRDRVAEPFVRGSDRSGTGLGLAIAQGFAEANGGRLVVGGDDGARLAIELPVAT